MIESPDHKCPHCNRQNVAIDQINPNLFLRGYVDRWHARKNQLSYSHASSPQTTSQKAESGIETTLKQSLDSFHDSVDENDPKLSSTNIDLQSSVKNVKQAPIVIKMQPIPRSQSPQPIVITRPADMTFEDDKMIDSDQPTAKFVEIHIFYLIINKKLTHVDSYF